MNNLYRITVKTNTFNALTGKLYFYYVVAETVSKAEDKSIYKLRKDFGYESYVIEKVELIADDEELII